MQQRKAKREADNVPTADGARGGEITGAGVSVACVEPARDDANKQHAEVIAAKHGCQKTHAAVQKVGVPTSRARRCVQHKGVRQQPDVRNASDEILTVRDDGPPLLRRQEGFAHGRLHKCLEVLERAKPRRDRRLDVRPVGLDGAMQLVAAEGDELLVQRGEHLVVLLDHPIKHVGGNEIDHAERFKSGRARRDGPIEERRRAGRQRRRRRRRRDDRP
mmetsp:Transcript_18386/g.42133  ORF Transcript_18386/g.42133 Transcript_18386/m.42133 type:complete len:218 (+) Transcript_18386:498-1151(+)